MANLGVTFYINILSVIATTYILTWYFLTPSPSQCQMTFMMEPPKFLPIQVEDDTNRDEHLIYPAIKTGGGHNQKTEPVEYKLYMYSEFGFPMASDVRRDLRDSMPVLFVPGNAGSYQQVRSLASTCIRRQLQSLDAFKFIFYTIDFGGQLSGMSGDLIDRQTVFVQKSLRQITRMHPSDTEGVILIGHSVGGFISKYLFTKPNFEPNSVPLMISLASPLTRPYLMLDDKMGEIYRKTEHYWSKSKIKDRDIIAISISGGGTDRLVPMHLSMDPHFDLSLTTECMKDVYLSTDHVCVTWCRELMHKLANLLSALMDKKQTRLISDKSLKLSIIEKQLLLKRTPGEGSAILSPRGNWSTKRHHKIINLKDVHHIHRDQLGDNIYLIKTSSDNNLLIIIDHIDQLKASTAFGCSSISTSDDQITCHGRSDLMAFASLIPTSRYEPRRTVIKLSEVAKSINHIGIDCTSYAQKTGPPEMVAIQRQSNQAVSELRIPSLLESLIRKLLFLPIRLQILPRLNSTTEFLELKLSGLEFANHPLSIALITSKCLSKGRPSSSTIIYYRNGYMSASAYLSPEVKHQQTTRTVMNLRQSIMNKQETNSREEQSYLNIYLDGTCENMLELELDPLNLAANMFQRDLGTILSCVTFLLIGSIVALAPELTNQHISASCYNLVRFATLAVGSALVVVVSRFVDEGKRISEFPTTWTDNLTTILLTLILSYGLLSFAIYFTRRLIDLATIMNNTHMILKRKVTFSSKEDRPDSPSIKVDKENGHSTNGKSDQIVSLSKTDIDWPVIGLAIASAAFLSSVSISVLAIFLLIKTSLRIGLPTSGSGSDEPAKHCCDQEHDDTKRRTSNQQDTKQKLIINLIIISSLVLVVNIPDLLLKLTNGLKLTQFAASTKSSSVSADCVAISLILILNKLICDRLERQPDEVKSRWMRDNYLLRGLFRLTASRLTSLLTIIPIILIESNIRLITTVALLLSMWLLNYLNFRLVNHT